MLLEIIIVLALILLNAVLALAELAIISARPARLRARRDHGAVVALQLAEDPGRFLSTVQIGITLVGVLSGAFSGATLGTRVGSALLEIGVPTTAAQAIGVGFVVVAITYLALVVGELVPKQIALSAPESIAARVAPTMMLFARCAAPLVWLLDRSGKLMLLTLGFRNHRDSSVTDEEIRLIIAEAESAGVIERGETAMIEGVMRIADRTARGLMTPRREVEIVDATEEKHEILRRFRRSGRSRLPLRDGGQDDIIGILLSRDLLDAGDNEIDPKSLLRPASIVHDVMPAMQVIERLRSAPAHILLVYDEYGHFEGIITPMDILGAIAGGFDELETDEPKIVERDDGSLLVAGWMPVDEFADRVGITLDADPAYATVAGLVLDLAADLPTVGQSVTVAGWKIEVVDMDGRRIDKLLVQKCNSMD